MNRSALVTAGLLVFMAVVAASSWAVPISDIQNGTIPVGSTATITGVVNFVDSDIAQSSGNYDFYVADAAGAYNGICIYQGAYGVDIGDSVTMTGEVDEYNGKTELKSPTAFAINSRGNVPYAPVVVTAANFQNTEYDGCLVSLENVQVTNEDAGNGRWQIQPVGGGTAVTIDDELDYNYFPTNGDVFDSITGIVVRDTSASPNQILQPRFTADFAASSDIIPSYALHGTVVTMDSGFNVYENAYIVVDGDEIAEVTTSPPAVKVIDVDGLIFPGLISTHDHLAYDMWDFIPFTEAPDFVGRNEWAATQMYCDFKAQYSAFASYYDQIGKLVEVRMASSGCTVTQSQVSSRINHSDDGIAKLGIGILNGERYPGRCYDKVVGTTDASDWGDWHNAAVAGRVERYIVHLAETTDKGGDMINQWNDWKSFASFDGYDTIIHGINIPAAEYALFNHGTDVWGNPLQTVLSWACKSNMLLYDETADVGGALAQGAVVALAPDWTESGMPNMLAELNFCRWVAFENAWSIQTRTFVEMVTTNAAHGFGQSDRLGSIEAGKVANFMVIDNGPGDPYDDLLMVAGGGADADYRCGPQEVKLTVVAGRPIYGDGDLLTAANFPFLDPATIEDITICSAPKKLSIARHANIDGYGFDELFNDFYLTLWEKYQFSSKYPCDFLSYDPADVLPPTPMPTPTPPAGTYVIIAADDDACDHNSYFSADADYIYIGNRGGTSGVYTGGFRFENFNVPQGATITSAVLYMTQYPYSSKTSMGVTVYGDKSTNSAAFSSGDQPHERPSTTATVAWTFPAPAYEATITSPQLSAIVEEIVGQGGWSAGSPLTLLVQGNNPAVDQRNRVYSYNADPAKAAWLVVEYDAVTPTPTPEGYKTPIPTPTPSYVNLLPNPSFEYWTGGTPDDWTPVTGAVVAEETGTVHAGSKSLSLSVTGTAGTYGKGIYADAEPTVEGNTYTFQMWVYSASPGSMGITANWYVGGSTIYWDTVKSTTANQWELLTVSSVCLAGATDARCAVRGFLDDAFCGYADDGACFEGTAPVTPTPAPPQAGVVGDYNGDGTSDIAVFRPSTGLWAVRSFTRAYYGVSTDRPVPGDYDGDGSWEIAVFRPAAGKWLVYGGTSFYYGTASDRTVPGDYNGDGTAELAVFRPSQGKWLVRGMTSAYYGGAADFPVPSDYDGDGADDIAVFRAGQGKWLIRDVLTAWFGVSTDAPVPADYDGDGADDIAVFRPGQGKWLVRNGASVYYGVSTDVPVPADYDGDGTADTAVFRANKGKWLINNPSVATIYFGSSNDSQVTNPYPGPKPTPSVTPTT